MRGSIRPLIAVLVWSALAGPAAAEDAVRAGELVVEPPTRICLGFEWEIAGDANRNAAVEVKYRPAGQTAWRDAMPLLRMGGEPKAAIGGRTLHVYPPSWKGPKEEPSFIGLMAAYAGAGTGDWNVFYR